MAKPKLNFQELLLKKGEYIALGAAGLGLGLLLVMGVMRGLGSDNPETVSKELVDKSKAVDAAIRAETGEPDPLKPWATGDSKVYPWVPAAEFPLVTLPFDPTAKPNLKRENPKVLGIGLNADAFRPDIKAYQVDLVRAPMKGYDIVYDVAADGKELAPKIAVRTTKSVGKQDEKSVRDAINQLQKQAKGVRGRPQPKAKTPAPGPTPPAAPGGFAGGPQPPAPGGIGRPGMMGPGMGGPGMGGPGMGGPGMMGPGGGGGSKGEKGGGYGGMMGGPGMGGGFEANAQRSDTVIEYVSLDTLDEAIKNNKLPAMTVIPLRMVVVNATFPLKDQIEEFRKALRLPDTAQAARVVQQFGFNGFNVRRRVILPNGTVEGAVKKDGTAWRFDEVVKSEEENQQVGFFPYNYEDVYTEKIDSRKLADHFEGADGDDAYLPYFYRYEDSLVMPFPELVGQLAAYPKVGLKPITDTIDKLKQAKVAPQTPSDLQNRLTGKKDSPTGDRRGRFNPKDAGTGSGGTGAGAFFGQEKGGAVGIGGKPGAKGGGFGGSKLPADKKDNPADAPAEIDHLLVRFIDCDVRPGYTYQYQIQIEMVNPNWRRPQEMANPAYAGDKYKVLRGDFVMLRDALTVPEESFLYAYDPLQYRQETQDKYKGQQALLRRLQAKEDQAAVQVMAWTEQVRTDNSSQREPVGAWVVAEMPVGRGEYIGRKTFVPLPLWSSESNQYVLRELSAEKVVKAGAAGQPKGWLVDFSSRSVLVDFEGGRVRTRLPGGRQVEDEVTAELLIARPDGQLVVRDAGADAEDANRKQIAADWTKWVADVEQNRAAGTAGNPFERPGGGKPTGGTPGGGTPGGGDN